jgi:hypothetical protein
MVSAEVVIVLVCEETDEEVVERVAVVSSDASISDGFPVVVVFVVVVTVEGLSKQLKNIRASMS